MNDTILVALISLIGTLGGTFGGIVATGKLTVYRIEQLEKKVDKHNSVIERVYKLEKNSAVLEERVEVVAHEVDEIRKGV